MKNQLGEDQIIWKPQPPIFSKLIVFWIHNIFLEEASTLILGSQSELYQPLAPYLLELNLQNIASAKSKVQQHFSSISFHFLRGCMQYKEHQKLGIVNQLDLYNTLAVECSNQTWSDLMFDNCRTLWPFLRHPCSAKSPDGRQLLSGNGKRTHHRILQKGKVLSLYILCQ